MLERVFSAGHDIPTQTNARASAPPAWTPAPQACRSSGSPMRFPKIESQPVAFAITIPTLRLDPFRTNSPSTLVMWELVR
jgi:hypothetical protein